MAALGAIVTYHVDPTNSIDRPAIVMKTDGTNHDLHIFVDPAVDFAYWNFDPNAVPPVLIRIERNVLNGTNQGQFS